MSYDKTTSVKKGGRPPLSNDLKRTIEITVTINKQESEAIKAAIEKSNEKHPAIFYRKALLAAAKDETCNFKNIPEASFVMLRDLIKLGVNVNQIAKAVNTANKNGILLEVENGEIDKQSKLLADLIKKLSKLFFE